MMCLLACAAACRKDQRTEQLQALEKAYQSGVFTKEEYEAKKTALVGAPLAAPVTPAPATPATPPASDDPLAAIPDPSAAPPGLSVSAPPLASPTFAPAPVAAAAPVVKKTPPAPPPVSKSVPSAPPTYNPPPPRPAPRDDGVPPPSPAPVPAPVAGCTDPEPGGPAIQERYFNGSIEQVKRAAAAALQSLDFDIKQDSGREIEAHKRRHLSAVVGAGGEKVTLRFENSARGVRVTGETKKSFTGKLAQKSWTGAVLSQIACNLRGK